MKNVKGFTLIEILLVVSIIGLMSSVVLSSVNTAREKAHVAAIKQFSATIEHVLGNELNDELRFEDNLKDTSGSGFNASFQDAPVPPFVPGLFDTAVNLTEYSNPNLADLVVMAANSDMDNSSNGTIEFSFKQMKDNNDTNDIMTWRNRRPLFRIDGQEKLYVVWWGDSGLDLSTTHAPFTLNQWHHVVFTWTANYKLSGTGYYEFYLDGKLIASGNFNPTPQTDTVSFFGAGASGMFYGYVDHFRVYNAPLFDNE